jgi:hypothetical protein
MYFILSGPQAEHFSMTIEELDPGACCCGSFNRRRLEALSIWQSLDLESSRIFQHILHLKIAGRTAGYVQRWWTYLKCSEDRILRLNVGLGWWTLTDGRRTSLLWHRLFWREESSLLVEFFYNNLSYTLAYYSRNTRIGNRQNTKREFKLYVLILYICDN